MEEKRSKYIKMVLYVSAVTTLAGALIAALFFKGPVAIALFFGAVLGFFAPWVIFMLLYTFIALSTPTLGFGDEIKKQEKKK